jgi:hypothetical protein
MCVSLVLIEIKRGLTWEVWRNLLETNSGGSLWSPELRLKKPEKARGAVSVSAEKKK